MRVLLFFSAAVILCSCGELEEIWEDFEDTNEAAIDIIDPNDSPNTTSTTTTTYTTPPAINPTCQGTQFPPDGANGFLWKPESENDGKLVVILPSAYQKQMNKCTIYDGYVADSCRWGGVANGNRQHWRCPRPGSQYNAPALVVCNDGKQDCAWQVSTPWARVD